MQYIKYLKFLANSKKKRKQILQFLYQRVIHSIGKQKKGRSRSDVRKMIAGILYYLKSGCSWEMLPNDFGPHQTVYGWYVRICDEEIFAELFQDLKIAFFSKSKKKITRICTDGSLIQHCRKNELTGINPRNKNKSTLNRILTTDESGLPLNAILAHGTAHDSIFFSTSIYNSKKGLSFEKGWISHADKGFDSAQIRRFIIQSGGKPEIPYRRVGRFKGIKNKKDSHRFVVERTFAWMNSWKNLKIVFIQKSQRIKEMIMLFMDILYLKRMSICNILNQFTSK